MLDIGGRQQLRPNYLGGRSYPQQDEPLSSDLECSQGSNRNDAAPSIPTALSDSFSQPRCLAQPGNTKAISLFSTEELLEQQLSSTPERSTVCQRLTMTTNSRTSNITDSSPNSTADIAVAAVSRLVQNPNALPSAAKPLPTGLSSDPSLSFPPRSKHSTLRSPASPFCSSSHQIQKPPNLRFSMSPQTFPLQQPYHFVTNVASSASDHCRSIDREASSQGNLNDGKSTKSVENVGDSGESSQYNIAFITNRLEKQELLDDAIAVPQANYPDDVHSLKDMQVCNISVSPTKSRIYPSSPLKNTSSLTSAGSDSCPLSLSEGSDLQSTVKKLLGLRLGERAEPCVAAVSSHHFISSNNNDTQCSVYSGLIPLKSLALSTSSSYSNVQTENTASNKLIDPAILSSIGMVTCHNANTFTDMSPGTPPDPPKKKHCRSLSIPSGSTSSGNSRVRRSTGGLSSDPFRTTDSSHCCISLLKPIDFTHMNESSNPPRVQQQQTLPFSCYLGQGGPSPDVQKTSPFSLSTSPRSPNTNMSASLTSLMQPTSFRGLFSSAQISGPVSTNRNGSLPLAALVKTPASTSTSPSQLHMAVTMLTSSPPPLTSDKPSSLTQSSSCCQSPRDSPVPRPASVSVLGCRYEDDAERAFKPVSDPWQCRSPSRGNSGYSSPSSCSSSSSFLLVPPQSDSRSNTEIQSATVGGLLAAPVPRNQTPRSSPTCIPTSLSSPATVIGSHAQAPCWPFQKHRSFSLEEQLSQMGKPRSSSPSSFVSPSPPSSSSSVLSSPSHYHQPYHHHPYQLPAPVFQTQQYQPSFSNHIHLHHHHQFQQQQQQQQQALPAPPQPQPQPQTVSAGGSTPSVPVACKSSISNPSSPRRQRIPRCRSQPCVLHDRREGRKRRRDYDRPTLDFHKMTQELWTGLQHQPMVDNNNQWPTSSLTTSTANTLRISTMQPSCPISLEVLRKTDFLASEHGDDPLSEDAEISAATEAAEAAARAAASAATTTVTTATSVASSTVIITAAVDSTIPAAMTTTAVAMDDDDDDDVVDGSWECSDLRQPVLFGRSVNLIGRDMSVYVSDESNPSFCGCDDDDDDEEDDDDDMGSDERVDGVNFQRTNCMFPITDLDLNQIENH